MPDDKQDDDGPRNAGRLSFGETLRRRRLLDELRANPTWEEINRAIRPGPIRNWTDNRGDEVKRDAKAQAYKDNIEAHSRGGGTFDPVELLSMLDDMGDRWREVWTMMPRDHLFDTLYAMHTDEDKQAPFLYRKVPDDVSTHCIIFYDDALGWQADEGPREIVEWLIDNPPDKSIEAIAELYQHSAMIDRTRSPWVLFVAMIGTRKLGRGAPPDYPLIVGDIRSSIGFALIELLMPVGAVDASYLGRAVMTWGVDIQIAGAYVHLIDAYDAHLVG